LQELVQDIPDTQSSTQFNTASQYSSEMLKQISSEQLRTTTSKRHVNADLEGPQTTVKVVEEDDAYGIDKWGKSDERGNWV